MTSETGVTALTNTSVGINGVLDAGIRAHTRSFKSALALSGVGIAMVASLATPAQAECTTDGDTVTCDDVGGANGIIADFDPEIAGLAGPDATIVIEEDAEVIDDGSPFIDFGAIFGNPALTGELDFTNDGTLGEDGSDVVAFAGGDPDDDGSTATFLNSDSGEIFGSVELSGFGGGAAITNDGEVSGSLGINTSASATITNTGESGRILVIGGSSDVDNDFDSDVDGDVTTNTTDNATTQVGSTVSVSVAAGATSSDIDIDNAAGSNTIFVGGTVDNPDNFLGINVNATRLGSSSTLDVVEVIDASEADVTVSTTTTTTSSVPTSSTTVTTTAGSRVGGDINLTGQGTTTNVSIGGLLGTVDTSMTPSAGDLLEAFSLNVNSTGTNTSNTTTTFDAGTGDGPQITSVTTSSTDASGAITAAVTAGGRISGEVSLEGGDAGATLTGTGGAIDGNVFVRTTNFGSNNTTSAAGVNTSTPVGGDVAVSLTDFAVGGSGEQGFGLFQVFAGGGMVDFTSTNSTFGFDDSEDGEDSFTANEATIQLNTTGTTTNSETAMGTTTVDQIATAGDVNVTLDMTTVWGGFDIDTTGGAVTFDATDSTIQGVDGEDGFININSAALEVDSVETVTATGTSVTSDDMLTTTNTTASTNMTTVTNTNVGGDVTVTLNGSDVLGDVTVNSGSGDIALTVDTSLITDNDGETVSLTALATDSESTLDESLSTVETIVDTVDMMTQTTTTVVDNSRSAGGTSTAAGGDIAVTVVDSAPIFDVAGDLDTDLGIFTDVTARTNGGTITVGVTDSAIGDEDRRANVSLNSTGASAVVTDDDTEMSTTVAAMTTAETVLTATTTTNSMSTSGSSAGTITTSDTNETTDAGGAITVDIAGSSTAGNLSASSGAGAIALTVTDTALGEDNSAANISLTSNGGDSTTTITSSRIFDNTSGGSTTTVDVVDDMMAFVSSTETITAETTTDETTESSSMGTSTDVGGDITVAFTDTAHTGDLSANSGAGAINVSITELKHD